MPSEMVERVARALWDAQSTRSGTWDVLHPSKQVGMRDRARAAIGAMRDPTAAMYIASEPWLDADNAAGFWRVMIDAAQSDG